MSPCPLMGAANGSVVIIPGVASRVSAGIFRHDPKTVSGRMCARDPASCRGDSQRHNPCASDCHTEACTEVWHEGARTGFWGLRVAFLWLVCGGILQWQKDSRKDTQRNGKHKTSQVIC